jgi:uncharacterized protein DUF4255
MFIRDVDEGLERLVRARLPLPEDIGDISFDAPTGTWAAQLSRLTVNLFLYHLDRSNHPTRAPQTRIAEDGRPERRGAQPMIDLGYLVSAWAGSPRDEHQLLGDVVSMFAGFAVLPAEFAAPTLNSSVFMNFGGDDLTRPRDIWQGVSGQLKACGILRVTVAADTWDWEDQAPAVERIAVLSSPKPR